MIDIKKFITKENQWKGESISQTSYIFLYKNFCKTPYIDVYVDLQATVLVCSVLLPGTYHQIVKSIQHRTFNTILKPLLFLSNITSVFFLFILCLCPENPLDIKKKS